MQHVFLFSDQDQEAILMQQEQQEQKINHNDLEAEDNNDNNNNNGAMNLQLLNVGDNADAEEDLAVLIAESPLPDEQELQADAEAAGAIADQEAADEEAIAALSDPRLQDPRYQGIPTTTLTRHLAALDKIQGNDMNLCLEGLQHFRRFLSKARITNFEISTALRVGILPLLYTILIKNNNAEEGHVQYPTPHIFESLWIITNIASGSTQLCQEIIDEGLIPLIARYLTPQNEETIVDQAIWAFGNIVGDGAHARDVVLDVEGVFEFIVEYLTHPFIQIRRNAAWTLSNFFRFKPRPSTALALQAIPKVIAALQSQHLDGETEVDLLWALSYLSDDNEDENPRVQAICDGGVLPRLISRLIEGPTSVQTSSLRTLGNVCTGTDHQTQCAVDAGVIGAVYRVLIAEMNAGDGRRGSGLKKECCWLISNLMAGTNEQKEAVLKFRAVPGGGSFVDVFVTMLALESMDICKEIFWVFANASVGDNELESELLQPTKSIPALSNAMQRLFDHRTDGRDLALKSIVSMLCHEDKPMLRVNVQQMIELVENEDIREDILQSLESIRQQRRELVDELDDAFKAVPVLRSVPRDLLKHLSTYVYGLE